MDKGARRRSKRRSLRLLKSVTVTADDEDQLTGGGEGYGTVWLSENDNVHSPSHSQKDNLHPPSHSESDRLQSPLLHSESDRLQSPLSHSESDNLCSSHQTEQFQSPCRTESNKLPAFRQDESEKFGGSLHTETSESNRSCSPSNTEIESDRLRLCSPPSYSECKRPQSPSHIESIKLQSSSHIESNNLQSPTSCYIESNKLQSPSSHIERDNLPSPSDGESSTLLSPFSPNKSDRAQSPLSHTNGSDKCQSPCHNESGKLWTSCQNTPKVMCPDETVVGTPPSLSICQKEITLTSTDDNLHCASCMPQTLCSDADHQVRTPCTTPICNELECEMDSESSLNQGFFCLEESQLCLDSSAETTPVSTRLQPENTDTTPVTTTLQPEGSEDSWTDLDSTTETTLNRTNDINTVTQQSLEEGVASSSSDMPVSLITSQNTDDTELSDSAFTPVSNSAERLDSALITGPAYPHALSAACVTSDQRQSSEGIGCGSVVSVNGGGVELSVADDADITDRGERSIQKSANEILVTDIGHGLMEINQSESDVVCAHKQAIKTQYSEDSTVQGLKAQSPELSSAVYNDELSCADVPSFSDVCSQDGVHIEVYSVESSDTPGDDTHLTANDAYIFATTPTSPSKQTEIVCDSSDACVLTITTRTKNILQQDSSGKSGELNLSWSPPNQTTSQESRQIDKRTKELQKVKKQRRRSACGAELKLRTVVQQDAATTSSSPLQTVSQRNWVDQNVDSQGSYPASAFYLSNDDTNTVQLLSGVSHENCDHPLQDQSVDRPADDFMKSGMTCDKERKEQEEPTKQESQPKRKRSRSSQVLLKKPKTSTSSEEFGDGDTNIDSESVFTKRRSSIRLSLRLCRKTPLPVSSSIDENGNTRDQPLPPVMTGETDSLQSGCSADSTDTDEEPGSRTIPAELEQLYRNKNFKQPADKTWETIFESPSRGKVTSKQKLKRFIKFEDHVPMAKLKRRLKKAEQNGWRGRVNKSKKVEQNLLAKLEELDKDISDH